MTEDELLVAQLAATSQGFMNHLTRGAKDGDFNANRTDWRRFLQQGGRPNPQQYPQNYPPQHNQYPQNYPQDRPIPPIAGDYGDIPSEVPSQINQIPMPRDAQGNMIIPPELAHLAQPQQQNNGLQVGGFDIPNYGGGTHAGGNASESKVDTLIKEVKLLKRAINTLTNLVKKSILDNVEPKDNSNPQPETVSEIKD